MSICGDCSQVFELSSQHPMMSKQGLRDREFTLDPPEGTFRVLVLGDSVPFGVRSDAKDTFPKQLEGILGARWGKIEIINGGVPGYGPYNEWQLYLNKLRRFRPHLVLVSVCRNDVVDPSLHWQYVISPALARNVPPEAIPNPAMHRDRAMPEVLRRDARSTSRARALLLHSEVYRRFDAYRESSRPAPSALKDGKRWSTMLSGEDFTSMDVLVDDTSVEWSWMRGIFDKLGEAIRADGARMALVIHPLAYELDPDYPFSPAPAFSRYCDARRIRCFDVLPALRTQRDKPLFLGRSGDVLDIWHYTKEGHRVAAEALAEMLLASDLLPPKR